MAIRGKKGLSIGTILLIITVALTLLLTGCSMNVTWLNEAIDNQDYEAFQKYLAYSFALEEKPYPDFFYKIAEWNYKTPLQRACSIGNYQMVKDLVDAGADVNYTEEVAPYSPLMYAVMSSSQENFEIVKFLVCNGASVIYREEDYGHDALCKMVIEEHVPNMVQMMDFLTENGADIYYKDNNQASLLHVAASEGNDQAIRHLLLNYDFDPNATTLNGDTALIFYCRTLSDVPEKETVSLFLEQGADPTIVNQDGKTAYDYALEKGQTEIAELLK